MGEGNSLSYPLPKKLAKIKKTNKKGKNEARRSSRTGDLRPGRAPIPKLMEKKQKTIIDDLKFYERKTNEFLEAQKYTPSQRGFTEKQRLEFYRSLNNNDDKKLKYLRAVLVDTLARLNLPARV